MPQHKQAKKRVRQNKERRKRNRKQRSKMRTLIKNVLQLSDKEQAQEKLKEAESYLDKMSSKGRIHPNNAARKKSKMQRHVNSL
ncbi:MAG TPA: 30S ribosomal protein S20 [Balneolaceae bacterium]|nr:30S ribosomal protein S20 [Balneolaceae bacterium]